MIEARSMYRRKNMDGTYSFMLVLSTTRAGMTVAYLAPENASRYYENIKSVWFEDFQRYVAFDRTCYISWSKINSKYYEMMAKVPFRVISKVTTAIKHLYDGMIVQDENGIFCYFDEDDDPPHHKTTKEKKEETVTINSTISVTTTAESLLEKAEEFRIPIEKPSAVVTSGKMVNLLEVSRPQNYSIRSSTDSKKRVHKRTSSANIARALYSEDEVLAIANMSINAISSKYKVSSKTAQHMRHNAVNFINGVNLDTRISASDNEKNEITKLFEEGKSVDQVAEITGIGIGYARSAYKQYLISRPDKEDSSLDVFESIKDNPREMLNLLNEINMMDFALKYGCSRNKAKDIYSKIEETLSRDILFVAGCRDLMYRDDIDEVITLLRQSDKTGDRALVTNYDTACRLKQVYLDTWTQHADIDVGCIPVPDSVAEEDKYRFLSLVYNRFSYHWTFPKNRVLSPKQKEVLYSGDSLRIATEFMIPYEKAVKTKYRVK